MFARLNGSGYQSAQNNSCGVGVKYSFLRNSFLSASYIGNSGPLPDTYEVAPGRQF